MSATSRYAKLVERLERLAQSPYFNLREIGRVTHRGVEYPMFRALWNGPHRAERSVSLSAGMHGDEPAGVEALARFIERHLEDERLLRRFRFTVFPCDNPSGYALGTRENARGIDLNREWKKPRPEAEVALLRRALTGRRFHLSVELHEDIDSHGFYLYEIASGRICGRVVLAAVERAGFPINLNSSIEGRPAHHGLICAYPEEISARRKLWPKAFYLVRHHSPHNLTFEAPGNREFEERVQMELLALETALSCLAAGRMDWETGG